MSTAVTVYITPLTSDLPKCYLCGEIPVVEFTEGLLVRAGVHLGNVDDPAAYLRGWSAGLERLASEIELAAVIDANQPVPFVPTEGS